MTEPLTHRKALPDDLALAAQASLAARVAQGEGTAEEELARLFHRRVFVMMLARVREADTARDLTQDVLMAVVLALRKRQLREGEKLAAFVYGIGRNVANGFFRSRPPDSVPLCPEHATTGTEDVLDGLHRTSLLSRLLGHLDPADRQILELTLTEGLKSGEIARRLGLSAEVVRARKSRAIKKATTFVREASLPGSLTSWASE
jgi:RNA polymerase sigma factor (sigma-70 family)